MAIDLNKMRAKLTALQNRGEKKDSAFWRPEDGEQTIRIVPTADGDPFKEYWFHYNLGKNPGFLSPKRNFGIDDPLNDFVRQLFKEGTEDSIKMAKNLMARQRFFAPVLVRGLRSCGFIEFAGRVGGRLLADHRRPERHIRHGRGAMGRGGFAMAPRAPATTRQHGAGSADARRAGACGDCARRYRAQRGSGPQRRLGPRRRGRGGVDGCRRFESEPIAGCHLHRRLGQRRPERPR